MGPLIPGCTTVLQPRWNVIMPRRKIPSRRPRSKPVRQSVTVPGPLVAEVRRVAKEGSLTMSRALVALAEREAFAPNAKHERT